MRAQNGSSWKQINSRYIPGDSLERGPSSSVAYWLGAARGMYRSLLMEGRGNDLGRTHRRQSGDCFESEEKGDGARMQKEAHNSGFLSSASLIPSPSLPASLSSSPLFSLLPSPPLPFSPSLVQFASPCLLHIYDQPRRRARGRHPSASGSPENVTCLTLTRLNIKKSRHRVEVNPWRVFMRQRRSCRERGRIWRR